MSYSQHFIINQIKNIGDVILCLPIASLLKKAYPRCKVSLLAQSYTHPVAKHCPDIDALLDWTQLQKLDDSALIEFFKKQQATTVIHLANNKRIAKVACQAQISNRVGTGQRIYHWWYCNKKINQARRHSRLHELQLNAQMLRPLGLPYDYDKASLIRLLKLNVPKIELPPALSMQLNSHANQKVILHPGSHGHGREWPMAHSIELAKLLKDKGLQVVLTGTDAEAKRFQPLIDACPFAINSMGQLSLEQLMVLIDCCDLLLASGTGPVHIAAALNKPTVGLFPPRKGISPRRWAPPGLKVTSLMHHKKSPCLGCRESEGCECMAKLAVNMVEAQIQRWLTQERA